MTRFEQAVRLRAMVGRATKHGYLFTPEYVIDLVVAYRNVLDEMASTEREKLTTWLMTNWS